MKKLIKIMAVTVLMASSVGASTLEEFDDLIAKAKDPAYKQVLLCEREMSFKFKNPAECTKAVDLLLEMKKKTTKTSLLRCEHYALDKESCKFVIPDTYQKTDNEFFDDFIAESYLNAGVVYGNIGDDANEVKMYKKALKISPNYLRANYNLGVAYYFGKGVETNKIKAYEHWKIAAKQGNQQAQKNLDILCSESPWACK